MIMSMKYLVFPNFRLFQGIHVLFLEIILEEYRNPLIGSPKEDPFHFPLTYCRQRSNMETDALLRY